MRLRLLYIDEGLADVDGASVLSVYLYDPDRRVHCCELTPSYLCIWVGVTCEKMPDDEDMRDEIREYLYRAGDGSHYRHCEGVDVFPRLIHRKHVNNDRHFDHVASTMNWPHRHYKYDTYEEVIEREIGYLCGNGYVE